MIKNLKNYWDSLTERKKISFYFVFGFLLLTIASIFLINHFSLSIKSNLEETNDQYHASVEALINQKFEQRELLSVSRLMDEKVYRINSMFSDLEKITELVSFSTKKFLLNNSKSVRKIYRPSDFFENKNLKNSLVKDKKFNVLVSYDYPDLILKNKIFLPGYSALYWELRDIYKNFYKMYPHVLWSYIGFSADGSFINYPGTYSEPDNYDPRSRPWYKRAVSSKSIIWETPYFDSGQGSLVITVAKAVKNPRLNNVYAVVGTDLVLKNLIEDIVNLADHYSMTFLITDQNGDVIFKSDEGKFDGNWQDLPNQKNLKKIFGVKNSKTLFNMPTVSYKEYKINGEDVYLYKRNLSGVNWSFFGLLKKDDLKSAYLNNYNDLKTIFNTSKNRIDDSIKKLIVGYFFQFVLFVLIGVAFYFLLEKVLVGPLNVILNMIKNFKWNDASDRGDRGQNYVFKGEIGQIALEFLDLENALKQQSVELKKKTKLAALGQLSTELAHDIRSPLAVLDIAVNDIKNIPEENRALIRSAVRRIHDIASDLLVRYKVPASAMNLNDKELASQPMSPDGLLAANEAVATNAGNPILESTCLGLLIEALISEKRVEYRHRLGVEITFEWQPERAVETFALADARILQRIVSNLINNAMESIERNGKITVNLAGENNHVVIRVSDNGKGIPKNILPEVTKVGASFGKQAGSGIGLSSAKDALGKWGATLEVSSETGAKSHGTQITLVIPSAEPPVWFCQKIQVPANGAVVVVDDDSSIHQVWLTRLDRFVSPAERHLQQFTSASEAIKWWESLSEKPDLKNALFLWDHEFFDDKLTGSDGIKKMGVAQSSVLVTSHWENLELRKLSEELGFKILPKGLAGFITMNRREWAIEKPQNQTAPKNVIDAVLIDDDPMIRMSWKIASQSKGKTIKTYENADQFFTDADNLHIQTHVYVDYELGQDDGLTIAHKIKNLGFENIYLATGYDADRFAAHASISGVVGKVPPWV